MGSFDDRKHMSRRAWFSRVLSPLKGPKETVARQSAAQVAVIAGRTCLPYQGTPCTMCSDQCPVPGAIVFEDDLPMVAPEVCTGCRICHEVCPAPVNAVLMVPRPPSAKRP